MNSETAKIENLFEVLADGNTTIHTAFEIWVRIDGLGDALVPRLDAAIASQNEDIASLAFTVLREGATIQSEVDLAPFVEPGIIALKHKNNLVKIAAMSFLKAMKGRAASAIPKLFGIVERDKDYIAANAIAAILQIDPNQIDLLARRIEYLLQSEDPEVKRVVLETLALLGKPAMRFQSILHELLQDEDVATDSGMAILGITGDPSELNRRSEKLMNSSDVFEQEYGKELKNRLN